MEPKSRYEVTVVLPAYNEAKIIGTTIKKIKEMHPEFEILVVDDGSTDHTLEEAMNAGATVWPHPYNIGNGAAIKSGLRLARGEWIVLMDADGQHQPEDIAKLLKFRDKFDLPNDNILTCDDLTKHVIDILDGKYTTGDILFFRKGEFILNPN